MSKKLIYARRLLVITSLLFVSAFTTKDTHQYRHIEQDILKRGEKMEYRVRYGLINAAEAVMQIDNRIHWMNKRPCYKVDIYGKTVGFFDMIMTVNDNWGSYIDTASVLPQRFYRYIEEGKYRKKEIVDFLHHEDSAQVHRLDKHTGKLQEKVKFPIPDNVQDMVSGYYYIRTMDFSGLNKDEEFRVTGFFDDTTYHLNVKFLGREKLKTKIGEFNTIVISPIVPPNSLFRGKNPVKAWLSDDRRKIPLRIKAELLIGSVEIDINNYQAGK